jgi:hypothetical protein
MLNSMMLITSQWNGSTAFKMVPVHEDCPYVEAIYDPKQKVMAVISKIMKEQFHMLPRLDESGSMIPAKSPKEGQNPYKQQRVIIDTFQEYYIIDSAEICNFIEMFAINHSTYSYKDIMAQEVSTEA